MFLSTLTTLSPVTVYISSCTYSAQIPLPEEYSLPSCLSLSLDKHTHNSTHILPGPHLYSWVGIKKWIKCLAERQKRRAMTGIKLGPQRRESSTVMPYKNCSIISSSGKNKACL